MWVDQKAVDLGFIWSSMGENLALLHAVYKSTDQLVHLCSLVPKFLNFFHTQLSTKFILLINVEMPTIVGILTFISMINRTCKKSLHFKHFRSYKDLKFHAQLIGARIFFYKSKIKNTWHLKFEIH